MLPNNKPMGKIAEKAVCRSVFLIILHCILSVELTKRTPSDCALLQTVFFFGDFAHWEKGDYIRLFLRIFRF